MYIYHTFFIHSSIDGHLGFFHVLAIVNSAETDNEIHMSFSSLVSSGYVPRSGIAGSYGGFGEGNGDPLQYSCLENPMDRGAWWATVHGVAKNRTRLSDFTSLHFITSHWSEWPSSKSLQTINAGEDVEKRERSCTVGGNVN